MTEQSEPIFNERGIIAEHYRDLQALPVLERARGQRPLPQASAASTMRAVFQSCEIALLNLADLLNRAATDVGEGAANRALVKALWARGFHRVLVRLALMPQQLGLALPAEAPSGRLRIGDSPAFAEYCAALVRFDRAVLSRVEAGDLAIDAALAADSLDGPLLALIHAARIANHDSTIWEANLSDVPVAAHVPSYAEFVSAAGMREAVYDRVLTGDTYFTQFRGLHQIPETLGEEVNDRLEQVIRDLHGDCLEAASDHLRIAIILADGMVASLPPMADNLATADYHIIRENLGLTSGSHSVCLRFHMFSDLYRQFADALEACACRERRAAAPWLVERLRSEALTFRSLIFQWRDEHLHMPRNNLGGGATKSLTGSPDAVTAVRRMRDAARTSDPMLPLARARGFRSSSEQRDATPLLRTYLESDASLDSHLLLATGRITQQRFVEVQERLGFFANKCPFSRPATRRVLQS